MNRMLAAAAWSAAVTTVSAPILLLIAAWVDRIDGLARLGGLGLVLVPVAVILLPAAAFIAGIGGGWVSRTTAGMIGSIGAYIAINAGAIMIRGGSLSTDAFGIGVYVVLLGLVVAGHLTGVFIRPRLRPA